MIEMTNAYILGANKYLRLKGQAVVRRRKDGQQWQEEDYIEAAKR